MVDKRGKRTSRTEDAAKFIKYSNCVAELPTTFIFVSKLYTQGISRVYQFPQKA